MFLLHLNHAMHFNVLLPASIACGSIAKNYIIRFVKRIKVM